MDEENAAAMEGPNQESEAPTPRTSFGRWLGGAGLILLGITLLINQFYEFPFFGQLFLPALGVFFLLWGIISRSSGPIIPGGILAGIGVGVVLMENLPLGGLAQSGVFLLSFGAGFGMITLLSTLSTPDKHTWALWPGFILALIGALMLTGGVAQTVLELLGTYWPVVFIGLGLYLIFKRR